MLTTTETGVLVGDVLVTYAQLALLVIGLCAYGVGRIALTGTRAAARGGWALGRRTTRWLTTPPPVGPVAARLIELLGDRTAWSPDLVNHRATRVVPGSGARMVATDSATSTGLTVDGVEELAGLFHRDLDRDAREVRKAVQALLEFHRSADRARRLGLVPAEEPAPGAKHVALGDGLVQFMIPVRPLAATDGFTVWAVNPPAHPSCSSAVFIHKSGVSAAEAAGYQMRATVDNSFPRVTYVIQAPGESVESVVDRIITAARVYTRVA